MQFIACQVKHNIYLYICSIYVHIIERYSWIYRYLQIYVSKYTYIKCGQMFVYVYHIYVCICGLIQSHLFCILTHIKYNQNLNFSLWWWYLYVCVLDCIEMWNFTRMSTFSKEKDIKLNRVWKLDNFKFKHWTKGEKLIKSGTPFILTRP